MSASVGGLVPGSGVRDGATVGSCVVGCGPVAGLVWAFTAFGVTSPDSSNGGDKDRVDLFHFVSGWWVPEVVGACPVSGSVGVGIGVSMV